MKSNKRGACALIVLSLASGLRAGPLPLWIETSGTDVPGQKDYNPYAFVKSPQPGMHFTEGLPLRIMADGGWPWADNWTEADFYVDGIQRAAAPHDGGNANYFESLVTGIPQGGPHLITIQAVGGGNPKTQVAVPVTIDPWPSQPVCTDETNGTQKNCELKLTADRSYANIDWNHVTVRGNDHKVSATAGVLIQDSFVSGLKAPDPASPVLPNATTAVAGLSLNVGGGNVDVERTIFEWTGEVVVNAGGSVIIKDNEFRANMFLSVLPLLPGSCRCLTISGKPSGTKQIQGNRFGIGEVSVGGDGWTIGASDPYSATADQEGNILMGARTVLIIDGSNDHVCGNYIHHHYRGGWSQGLNLAQDGGAGTLAEHNLFWGSSWVIQSFSGEFRYNLTIDSGHNWIRSVSSNNTVFHHNVFVHMSGDNTVNEGFWEYSGHNGIQFYNNVFDGGALGMWTWTVLRPTGSSSVVSSVRNNVFMRFKNSAAGGTNSALVSGTPRPDQQPTPPNGQFLYADYNAFYNPGMSGRPYDANAVTGKTQGDPGFGQNDVQTDPKLGGGMEVNFIYDEDDIWNRRVTLSQILAHYRTMYAPQAGSPVIDKGDPADGSGVDIGAVESGSGTSRPEDKFGKFGVPLPFDGLAPARPKSLRHR